MEKSEEFCVKSIYSSIVKSQWNDWYHCHRRWSDYKGFARNASSACEFMGKRRCNEAIVAYTHIRSKWLQVFRCLSILSFSFFSLGFSTCYAGRRRRRHWCVSGSHKRRSTIFLLFHRSRIRFGFLSKAYCYTDIDRKINEEFVSRIFNCYDFIVRLIFCVFSFFSPSSILLARCFPSSFILSSRCVFVQNALTSFIYLDIEIICDEQWLSMKCVLGYYSVFSFLEIRCCPCVNNKKPSRYIDSITLNALFCTTFFSARENENETRSPSMAWSESNGKEIYYIKFDVNIHGDFYYQFDCFKMNHHYCE